MVVVGILAFAMNWGLAWAMVRGQPGSMPLVVMVASSAGLTFAFGIVVSFILIQVGIPQPQAVQKCMDVAVYFGLPAAAWAAYCARHQDRIDAAARRRRAS